MKNITKKNSNENSNLWNKMRRFIVAVRIVAFSISSVVFISYSFADPVNSNMVKSAAETFLSHQLTVGLRKPALITTISEVKEISEEDGRTLAYIAVMEPEGFIIISADSDIRPIIGYSLKGEFPFQESRDNVLLHLVMWDLSARLKCLSSTDEAIQRLIETNNELWNKFVSGDYTLKIVYDEKDIWWPLLKTNWDQGYPDYPEYSHFNNYCPLDPTNGKRCVVGCTATAAAQIFNYWKYPTSMNFSEDDAYTSEHLDNGSLVFSIDIPEYSDNYDFPSFDKLNSELDFINYDGNETEEAYLCFATGIKFKMNYSSSVSGAYILEEVYQKLGFETAIYDDKWAECSGYVIDNIKSGWPVNISVWKNVNGEFTKGHAIVVDGYVESIDQFHVNLGWGGQYDAWYSFPNIHTWDTIGCVVYDITPTGTIGGRITNSVTGDYIAGATVTAAPGDYSTTTNTYGEYSLQVPAGTYTIKAETVGYESKQVSGVTVEAGITQTVNFQLTPYDNYEPTLKWKYYTDGEVSFSSALFNDCTMVGVWSLDGLYVLDSNGTLQWKYAIPWIYSSPCINRYGTIYVGSNDDCLYAIRNNGALLWKYQTNGEIFSSPAIGSDGTVYFGSFDSYVYAINPDGTLRWKYKTEGRIHSSSPAISSDGTIYIGSEDNYLYAFNPDGTLKWKYKTGGIICSSPAIGEDGTIYFGSWDGYLYAIHQNGSLKWKYQADSSIFSSPAINSSGSIYFGSTLGKSLYAINTEGIFKWKFETDDYIYSSPAVGVDGTVYVGSHDNYIYAVNSDGTLQWKYKTGDKINSSPVISSDGTVYIGSNDGYIYALESSSMGLDNGPWPMRGHDERHTGRFGDDEEINNSPTFVITTLPDATQDELYSVATTVEDPDLNKGDSLTFEILEVPEWLAINDYGLLTGTPTNNDVGTDIPLLIRVVDSGGLADTLSTSISVINVNNPPKFLTTELANATQNVSYTDTLVVEDQDADDILKFDILEGPEWLAIETIEDSLGVLKGTPSNDDVGTGVIITIKVEDTGGLSDTLSTVLNVINIPEPPYGLQVSDIPDDNGHSLMLTWSLSPDDDVISHYAVYRSRNPELTEAVPLEFFDSLEDLKAAEQEQTILIDTVNAGESAYTDTFVPVNGVTYYYWVATVSESGQTSKLAPLDNDPVKVSVYSVPGRFSLTGNFPNPFNASTSIQFEIPVHCHVKLDVFSVSGQHVTTLMDNPVSPGIHSFVWEPGNIAAGIYLYSLKAGGKQFVGKMVFLK